MEFEVDLVPAYTWCLLSIEYHEIVVGCVGFVQQVLALLKEELSTGFCCDNYLARGHNCLLEN